MALLLVFFYLIGAGVVLLGAIVATSFVLKEAPLGMVSQAEAAKTAASTTTTGSAPASADSKVPPVWVAPTRQYQADATDAEPKGKLTAKKESRKPSKEKGRKASEPTLSHAQEPSASFPVLNRD